MSQPQFLSLITLGWKTGKKHRIEIWFVECNKNYYVISEHGPRAHWVQNISHNPKVTFSVSNKTFEGTARIVTAIKESGLAGDVPELMSRKYGWSQGLIVEITPSHTSHIPLELRDSRD